MMKQFLFTTLFITNAFFPVFSAPGIMTAPMSFIIFDEDVQFTADAYSGAQYVQVTLLDASGRTQASATIQSGNTVVFPYTDASRRIRSVYHFDGGLEFVVVDELNV